MITLFVIDMQRGFSPFKDCIEDVIREIKLARRRNDGIVFVELDTKWNGHTDDRLMDAATRGGYKKFAITEKTDGDGSLELVEAAKKAGFQTKRVRVCGVSRYACVYDTLGGLINMKEVHKVEVGFAATAPGPKRWEDELSYMPGGYKAYIQDGMVIRR